MVLLSQSDQFFIGCTFSRAATTTITTTSTCSTVGAAHWPRVLTRPRFRPAPGFPLLLPSGYLDQGPAPEPALTASPTRIGRRWKGGAWKRVKERRSFGHACLGRINGVAGADGRVPAGASGDAGLYCGLRPHHRCCGEPTRRVGRRHSYRPEGRVAMVTLMVGLGQPLTCPWFCSSWSSSAPSSSTSTRTSYSGSCR